MNLGTPQIIYLALSILGLGCSLAKHGEVKKTEKYNFFSSLFANAITLGLLYWGGFFK